MTLEFIRLLFDFGLMVLIWQVQLIHYPCFLYFEREQLLRWHKKYTLGISIVVIPLMFGQSGTALVQLYHEVNTHTVISMFLIVCVWVSTFTQFVPLHNAISKGNFDAILLKSLVHRNWIRTALWSIIFWYSFFTYL